MFWVYKLQNNRGEIYYGMSKNPKARWLAHRNGTSRCNSYILWKDDGVVEDIEILEKFDNEELALEREKELIRNNNCVNISGKYTKQEQSKLYYEKNKEKIKQYDEKNKEKIRAYKKEYYENNKDEKLAYKKEYYENNKDETRAYMKEYYENNKEKIRAQQSEKIKCEICGCMVSHNYKAKHQRTAKCKSFLMDT